MSLGPLMIDIGGLELTSADQKMLQHPLVGGLILFTRNYQNKQQLIELIQSIRECVGVDFLIAVDQEGGRVQRFKEEFTAIPAMAELGYQYNAGKIKWDDISSISKILASELIAVGIDFSFAPVLDIDHGFSEVIGSRTFSHEPSLLADFYKAFHQGFRQAGMATVAKHFPGHGAVKLDSHIDLPVDPRELSVLEACDLIPFQVAIGDQVEAIMPAHIVYERIDPNPASLSSFWLTTVLRGKLKFNGAILSDDLSMGALQKIPHLARVQQALSAGCDMVLLCNDRKAVETVLENFNYEQKKETITRLEQLKASTPLQLMNN